LSKVKGFSKWDLSAAGCARRRRAWAAMPPHLQDVVCAALQIVASEAGHSDAVGGQLVFELLLPGFVRLTGRDGPDGMSVGVQLHPQFRRGAGHVS
jgi:hypothetical protein